MTATIKQIIGSRVITEIRTSTETHPAALIKAPKSMRRLILPNTIRKPVG